MQMHLHDLHLVYLTPSTWSLGTPEQALWQQVLTALFPLLSAIRSLLACLYTLVLDTPVLVG